MATTIVKAVFRTKTDKSNSEITEDMEFVLEGDLNESEIMLVLEDEYHDWRMSVTNNEFYITEVKHLP